MQPQMHSPVFISHKKHVINITMQKFIAILTSSLFYSLGVECAHMIEWFDRWVRVMENTSQHGSEKWQTLTSDLTECCAIEQVSKQQYWQTWRFKYFADLRLWARPGQRRWYCNSYVEGMNKCNQLIKSVGVCHVHPVASTKLLLGSGILCGCGLNVLSWVDSILVGNTHMWEGDDG